jgi:hypothetical protein
MEEWASEGGKALGWPQKFMFLSKILSFFGVVSDK